MRALLLACALLTAGRPAVALEPCFADSVGHWQGQVFNGPGLERLDTEFTRTPDDTLAATYHIADSDPFDGTLTDFTPTGPCEAVFVWHDRGGIGTVTIRFDPEHGQFRGLWGETTPLLGHLFDGDRVTPMS